MPLIPANEHPDFSEGSFPALDDYGITLAQATAAEDAALTEITSSREAGRLEPFAGSL
jgi:hypothetical protein